MTKFEFRVKRSFDEEYNSDSAYKKVIKTIERIKARCRTYAIQETSGGFKANAFDSMALPEADGEEYINDTNNLFFDAADYLLHVNEKMSGNHGWDAIADVIDTKSGTGIHNHHWTLNTYRLKPEYAQMLIDTLDEIATEVNANYENYLAKSKKDDDAREAVKQTITAIDTTEKTITDEGGKTKMYTHTITFLDGEKLTFNERNVFDAGTVVNPAYSVTPGRRPGGICDYRNGSYQWISFDDDDKWVTLRPLTPNEITAIKYLQVHGSFAGKGTRM